MRIIVPSANEANEKISVCPICKCRFAWTDKDLLYKVVKEGTIYSDVEYLKCPSCKKDILEIPKDFWEE